MTEEHDLVALARRTIERFVCDGIILSPPEILSDEMKQRAGTFVSLHRGGELRGCIGTIEPACANVAAEIIANAISAATRDPRFPPMDRKELADLDISVDVLTEPEPVSSLEELDPKRYGVIVQKGSRRGLLLPNLEGVDTARQQVEIALRKAWIESDQPYQMYRFEVIRYS
jgi:AmmeMemoRadiSam system protein A